MTSKPLAIAAIFILLVAAGAYWYLHTTTSAPITTTTPMGNMGNMEKESMVDFTSTSAGLSFAYPSSLFVTEKETGTPTKQQHSIVLVKNTPDNHALMDGTAPVAGEGPTAITIDIYQNTQKLAVRDWITHDTNWTVATKSATDTTVAGLPAVTYPWSGLYEGKSYIVAHGDKIYVLSVTWLTPEDQIIKDVDMVLNSLTF
jgi:hypothetical protein